MKISGRKRFLLTAWLKFASFRGVDHILIKRGSIVMARHIELGYGSRINGIIQIKGAGSAVIGRYCAIGHGVKIITTNHDTDEINTNNYVAKVLGLTVRGSNQKNEVKIGHNVWIGDNSLILPGVSIGDGAVIGAGSIVTKDVQRFTMVGGNPARLIKARLTPEKIAAIDENPWWDYDLDELADSQLLN